MDEYQALTDEAIVKASISDSSMFGVVIERYESKLRRYIERMGVRVNEDQSDVLQEIFIKAYRNLNSFDSTLKFSSWIYRIAHNEAISWYRKQKVRPEGNLIVESEGVLALIQSKEPGAEVTFDQSINQEELARAMSQIESKYREALVLRYFEQREYEEISDILRAPVNTVGTLILRGKKKLLDKLNKDRLRI